jgi:hypothetical protein
VNGDYDDEADVLANGTRLNVKDLRYLHYAQARGNFTSSVNEKWLNSLIRKASEAQKERDAPAVILVFSDGKDKICAKAAHALTAAGVSVIEKTKLTCTHTLSRTAFRGLPIISKRHVPLSGNDRVF